VVVFLDYEKPICLQVVRRYEMSRMRVKERLMMKNQGLILRETLYVSNRRFLGEVERAVVEFADVGGEAPREQSKAVLNMRSVTRKSGPC
jgi:hypothetical protein